MPVALQKTYMLCLQQVLSRCLDDLHACYPDADFLFVSDGWIDASSHLSDFKKELCTLIHVSLCAHGVLTTQCANGAADSYQNLLPLKHKHEINNVSRMPLVRR